jgi:Cu+-exporting ATPase
MSITVVSESCFHCGEKCSSHKFDIAEKSFCCSGCRSVFLLLHQHELDNYYCLNEKPGKRIESVQPQKFQFLDDEKIIRKLLSFSNNELSQVTFHLPQIHCSSCLWLLEHLDSIDPKIITSQVDFPRKEVSISFQNKEFSLRQLAELLTSLGYEPHILIENTNEQGGKSRHNSRLAAYKLGVTGFCFANIMLISFPEYLGMTSPGNGRIITFFRFVNLLLALPVVFYGAKEFFINAFFSFRQKYINIDAPIALAISVTFIRSVYEIVSQTGAGYLDSMSGIVFFMLLGRTLQNRTYNTLKFNRDYKSYFPIAVSVLKNDTEEITQIQELREHDVLKLHHHEVVPTDCMLSKGKAVVDYSFITGESIPESIPVGGLIYAGGKITGSAIEVIALKDFSQNSFIRIWNHQAFRKQQSERDAMTTVISKFFSAAVILIALTAWIYWQVMDPKNAWNALTAVLIVACPCALLLNTTFVNGHLMEAFAGKGLFLKNAQVIEQIAKTTHIAFDKTGTLTETSAASIVIKQMQLSKAELSWMLSVTSQSMHPLSKAITAFYKEKSLPSETVIKEIPGQGMEAWIEDRYMKIGSRSFITGLSQEQQVQSEVFVSIDGLVKAHFLFRNKMKFGIAELMVALQSYDLSLISGDNENSKLQMQQLFPEKATLLFNQTPEQKLKHIQDIQQEAGAQVMMLGDGLNDAGALQQSNVGIALVQNTFSFSPASDGIMEAEKIHALPQFLQMAKASQRLILIGFCYSIIFNIIGIGFAVTANLSPMVAAILMPASSLGIMLIAFVGTKMITR